MRIGFLLGLLVASTTVASEASPPDLPSRDAVANWLAADPAAREAEIGRSTASHEAGMLRASPNEWTVKATGQRREYDMGGTSREWDAGIERTVRLPGKRALDTRLGEGTIAIAEARYVAATRQALRDLVDLWMNWCAATEGRRLADRQAEIAGANRTAVEKRVKAGDASKLDLNLSEADLADVERVRSDARTKEAQARARLVARFGDVPPEAPTLSEPVAIEQSVETLKARLLQQSPDLRIADAEQAYAETAVSRERADRFPDPTLGAFSASEAYGKERIVGISISVPLPGSYRSQKLARALSIRDQNEAAVSRARQRVDAESAVDIVETRGSFESWQLARTAAHRADENVRLTQRAYTLGEADLQTLLLARRQSLDATRTAVEAQSAAIGSRYRLLIASAELWADIAQGEGNAPSEPPTIR
jgi:outer membrane protein TolC